VADAKLLSNPVASDHTRVSVCNAFEETLLYRLDLSINIELLLSQLQRMFALYSLVPVKTQRQPGPALADAEPMQDLGAGPNARPRRGAPLSSDFMTSSCSVNRVTIVIECRCTVQHQHENRARLLTFARKFAGSDESVVC